LETFKKLRKEIKNIYGFVIIEPKNWLPKIENLSYTKVGKYQIMAKSDLILLSSGTASLEAAILEVPHIVIYRLSPLTYWLARGVVKIKNFALANILLGGNIVPEFVQPTRAKVFPMLLQLLSQSNEAMKNQLSKVKTLLGQFGAAKRIAQAILSELLNCLVI